MNPNVWVARAGEEPDFMAFQTGARIEMPDAARIELGEESETPTDFMEAPYFIVSARMRTALDAFGVDNIQYAPVVLQRLDLQQDYEGYWLGNVIGLVSCVDPAKSTYKQLTGSKRVLRGFIVDETLTKGLMLFRLKENRRLVLIAERLKQHLQSRGLEGIYFQETLKFNGDPASSFFEQ
jgi:hypothetical protein